MAAQKLFGDFPTPMGGGVTPLITSDITQRSAEDDPNTMAGYRARLAAQRESEDAAFRGKRGLQLQWEQEDKARAEAEERAYNEMRRKAFETIYRPSLEQEARTQWGVGHMSGRGDTRMGAPGYTGGAPVSPYGIPIYGQPNAVPKPIPMIGGVPVYGGDAPQYNLVQPALDAIWGRTRAMEMAGFRPQPMQAFAPTAASVYGYGGSRSRG
jgi:hypothetical protein